jgi:hypothetical protein
MRRGLFSHFVFTGECGNVFELVLEHDEKERVSVTGDMLLLKGKVTFKASVDKDGEKTFRFYKSSKCVFKVVSDFRNRASFVRKPKIEDITLTKENKWLGKQNFDNSPIKGRPSRNRSMAKGMTLVRKLDTKSGNVIPLKARAQSAHSDS